jgi:large subunit ribosomal protein L17
MRHLKAGRKLSRTSSHRLAILRNMVTSLIEHERIQTTDAKAKEIRRLADKMITLGKRGDLHARRQAMKVIRQKAMAKKLFENLAPKFKNIHGGYTRVIKVKRRHGDNAPVSLVEFSILSKEEVKQEKKSKKKKDTDKKQQITV